MIHHIKFRAGLFSFSLALATVRAGAAEAIIFHDTVQARQTLLTPGTELRAGPSWEGNGHIAFPLKQGVRAKLGFFHLQVKVDKFLDWPSAMMEFYVDPGPQILTNCAIYWQVRGFGSEGRARGFHKKIANVGNGVAGFQRVNSESVKRFRESMASLAKNWSVAAVPTPVWAKAVFPDLAESEAVEALWEAVLRTCRIDRPNSPAASSL